MKTKFILFALVVATSAVLPVRAFADGGWLNKKWDPSSTNSIPRLAMPATVSSPVSAGKGKVAADTAKSVKHLATMSLPEASGSAIFSPSGLSGRLPAADDSRIQELARGLDHNWERCFDFVRNHILFTPYPGIMKGPERTLLDREGNAADQSFLLCALLRASGYTTATVLCMPLNASSPSDGGFIFPTHNYDGKSAYNAADWLCENSEYGISRKLGSNGLYIRFIDYDHLAIEHYWVRVEIDGESVDLDPSIKQQIIADAENAKIASGYNRSGFLAAAGGTVDSNSARNLSADGIAAYLKARVADLKAAWKKPGASIETILGKPKITPRAPGDPRFHGVWSSHSEPIDLLASSSADVLESLRTKVTLDNYGNNFETLPMDPDGGTEFSFYLDEVGSRTLWFAKDGNGDLGFFVDEEQVSQSATWKRFGAAGVGVDVACGDHPTYHSYTMRPNDGEVHVLSVNLGGDDSDGIRKVASKRILELKKRGFQDSDNVMRAALLQLQGQEWLSQVELHTRLWSRVVGGDSSHYYNIGIAGQAKGPFVDMANSYGRGYGGSGIVESHMMFSSALEHSVIEQLNGEANLAVSTVKILSLANAKGDPIYFAHSKNIDTVVSSLSGYSDNQKNMFSAKAARGEIYLLPKNATVTLNEWTGAGYVSHGPTGDGGYHTGMIISGGMNGGYATYYKDPETGMYVVDKTPDVRPVYIDESTQADPVSMPSGAFLDNVVDLFVARAVPLAWTRSYDTRCAESIGDLGRGWSHGFESSIVEASDADAALGSLSLDAALPVIVASVVAEDMMSEADGLLSGEIARRWTAAALVANWWTEQLMQTYVVIKLGNSTLPFMRMPDGTFAGGSGVTTTLTCDADGCYSLKERFGNTYAFNRDKKLETITDPSGNVTTFSYMNDLLVRVENSFGASMTITRDSAGRITFVTDNSGKSVSYSYNSEGCMIAVTDSAGEVWPYGYDPATYCMTFKKDPYGNYLIRNTYNENDQVESQISSNGGNWKFGYVANVEAWNEDPKGGRLTEVFDSDGRVLSRTQRDGSTSMVTYNGHGLVSSVTDALGNRTTFSYDSNDNLISSTEGAGALKRTTRLGYDGENHLIALTNSLGAVMAYEYDNCDRLIKETAPDGTYKQNVWNANGTLSAIHTYDASGAIMRSVSVSNNSYGFPLTRTLTGIGIPDGGITSKIEYNADGSVSVKVDALGNRSLFAYDGAGRLVETTDALGNVSKIEYNKIGKVDFMRDTLGREMHISYNTSGLPTRTTFPNGFAKSIEYDVVDDVMATTDERGARRVIVRDAVGRPVVVTNALGFVSKMAYDELGRLVWSKDASGTQQWNEYDILSRLVIRKDAFGAQWKTDYDNMDRVVATTSPLGKMTRINYDNVGHPVASSRPSGAVDSFGYDALGNQTSYTNAEGHVYQSTYDALGREVSVKNALNVQIATKAYDLNGNLAQLIDGEGAKLSFSYDALNRLVKRTTLEGDNAFMYDSLGNILLAGNDTVTETFSYDSMNRLVGSHTKVFGLSVQNEWWRDAGGLVTNIVYDAGRAISKQYDAEGRIASVSDWLGHTWRFEWDGVGRLIGMTSPDGRIRTQTYDVAGRLKSWGVGDILGRSLEYDLSGRKICDNVTAGVMPVPNAGRHTKNAFNAADQLVSSTVELGNGTTRLESFTYNRNGALICATDGFENTEFRYNSDGTLAGFTSGGVGKNFCYDALNNRIIMDGHIYVPDQNDVLKRPLAEYDIDGNLIRYYIWVGGMLIGYIDAQGVLTVAHSDEMGGVAALSRIDGSVIYVANYGPHGEDWGHTGLNPTPFAWLGGFGVHLLSRETHLGNLYLTRHRLYSAALQRFLSADPLGLSGGLNLYAYGNGNPLMYIDPLGLCSEGMSWSDWGHMGLDAVGMIPGAGELADGLNGLWYLAEGDYGSAVLSFTACVPGAGNFATGAKWAKNGQKAIMAVKKADNAVDAVKGIKKVEKVVDNTDNVLDARKAFAKIEDNANAAKKTSNYAKTGTDDTIADMNGFWADEGKYARPGTDGTIVDMAGVNRINGGNYSGGNYNNRVNPSGGSQKLGSGSDTGSGSTFDSVPSNFVPSDYNIGGAAQDRLRIIYYKDGKIKCVFL